MKVSSAVAATSTRLNREMMLPPQIELLEERIANHAVAYCNEVLDQSRFFNALKDASLPDSVMQYAFLQYHFWRDQLHRWFGLCIIKAGRCSDPHQKGAIMALSDHIFTDLRDGHDLMFVDFLHDLGLDDATIDSSTKSIATEGYERSFTDDFGFEADNFYQTLAALSGREISVAVRNGRILQQYFTRKNMPHPLWLTLHAELEVDHFRDAVRPVLMRYGNEPDKAENLIIPAVQRGIDRHFKYFDELFAESGSDDLVAG
ncbi:MAG TPA: iron-containing redox enzyme family protein [Candidatus Baltobacteraceae bacterium]|jgi:thiaminase|nr:iron-containing redox enzyme family protein [Candidatus Baltobacteraceae bacterium]